MKRALPILLLFIVGCSGAREDGRGTVLMETADNDSDGGVNNVALSNLVSKDATRASEILTLGLENKDPQLAAWAAVYVLRLGVKHDRKLSSKAIEKGATLDNELLAALCWRWICADKSISLPKWTPKKNSEPVLELFAAIAHKVRGVKLSMRLIAAISMPEGEVKGESVNPSERVMRLERLAMPFDGGPLSMAITLVEARRNRWTALDDSKKRIWVAGELLVKLQRVFELKETGTVPTKKNALPSDEPDYLAEKLEDSLYSQPLNILRGAVVTGKGSLRIAALRGLAIVAVYPEAGDFGAAAGALSDEDMRIRIEAARTYLLFTARATK